MEIEAKANWIEFKKPADLNSATTLKFDRLFVLLFYTSWNEFSLSLKTSLESLSEFILEPIFIAVNADEHKDIGDVYGVVSIPSIVYLDGSKLLLKKWENPQPSMLYDQIKEMVKFHGIHFEKTKSEMTQKVHKILAQHDMVIFIKGSPSVPKCKFTRQLLEELAPFDLNYFYFDILQDEDVRSWNRYISGKNTYPQIYFNQKLIGGLDDLRSYKSQNLFETMIPEMARKDIPIRRATRILTSSDVVAVLNCDINEQLNEKSKELIDFLKTQQIKFNIYNGEADQQIKTEIKSRCGSDQEFPFLFIQGQFAGEIESLKSNKEFLKLIPLTSWKIEGKEKFEMMQKLFSVTVFVDDLTKELKALHFIKSLKDSNKDFAYIDISKDSAMKSYLLGERMNYQGLQVYIKGELKENLEME